MKLNKEELVHPIFKILFIAAACGTSFNSISDVFYQSYQKNSELVLYLIFTYFTYNLLNISRCTELKENEIIDGYYFSPFGFIKIKNRIELKDIKELIIHRNEKKYSEIRVISVNGNFLVIKTIANRIPAEEELAEIKTKINAQKAIIQVL